MTGYLYFMAGMAVTITALTIVSDLITVLAMLLRGERGAALVGMGEVIGKVFVIWAIVTLVTAQT